MDPGASTVPDHSLVRQIFDGRNNFFATLYKAQLVKHATPSEVNVLCGKNGQTATCARRAIDAYNQRNGTKYKLEKGGDSNVFKLDDATFYVHLNCVASDPMKGRQTFFAELMGENEPLLVKVVVSLGNIGYDMEVSANSADHNCLYCTGLRHSLTEEFKGFINVAGLD